MDSKILLKIDVYSHHVVLSKMTTWIRGHVLNLLSKEFTESKFRRVGKRLIKEKGHVFASLTRNKSEIRLSINQMSPLLKMLRERRLVEANVNLVHHGLHRTHVLNIPVKEGWIPRDYQVPYIEYLSKHEDKPKSKLLGIQTGKGKGISLLFANEILNKVTAVVLLPKYIEKWTAEILEKTDATMDDIYTVRGGESLETMIRLAKEDRFHAKYIIISNRTMLNYIKNYKQCNGSLRKMKYSCKPIDLFKVLGVGTLLYDEVHQEFHANYTIAVNINVKLIIGLSATLENNDRFLNSMYRVLFPLSDRPQLMKYDKYAYVHAVSYRINNVKAVKTSNHGDTRYSHVAFENHIIKSGKYGPLLKDYLKMIDHYVKISYLDRRKKGERLAIFMSTVELCTIMTEYLKNKYKELSIERYVAEDPYENVIEPDIRITTVLSAGTAIDIKNLLTVIQTISVNSLQSNLQTFGRLRPIEGREVRFYYMYCNDIASQSSYHVNRTNILTPRCVVFNNSYYDKLLGG